MHARPRTGKKLSWEEDGGCYVRAWFVKRFAQNRFGKNPLNVPEGYPCTVAWSHIHFSLPRLQVGFVALSGDKATELDRSAFDHRPAAPEGQEGTGKVGSAAKKGRMKTEWVRLQSSFVFRFRLFLVLRRAWG